MWDPTGDLQYTFGSSVQDHERSLDGEYIFGGLTVKVCGLINAVEEILRVSPSS